MRFVALLVCFVCLAAFAILILTSGKSYDGLILPFIILPAGLAFQAIVFCLFRFYMDNHEFIGVAQIDDVPDPGSMLIEVEDRLIALIHAAGHWYALDDVCTHDGGPLSDGPIDSANRTLACPRHGAKFDLATGAALTMPATKPTVTHEVKVEGERVLVRLHEST